jgi:AmiR/NasT family two-component response regulator
MTVAGEHRQPVPVTILVLLVGLPALLADIVREALTTQMGTRVQAIPEESDPRAILARDPDVVVVGVEEPGSYAHAEFPLSRRPGLGLLAISADARRACVHELSPVSRLLDPVSGATLRQAVRIAVARADALREPL